MRKSRKEAAATRSRIVVAAAAKFRSDGIGATGLADLMKAAGMTHGGFYKHFESKDELVTEAVDLAIDDTLKKLQSAPTYSDAVSGYLSLFDHNGAAGACPLTAIGIELSRADKRTRCAVTAGFERFIQIIEDKLPAATDRHESRERALFAVLAMVGALTLSQIVEDAALSREILDVVKRRIGDGPQSNN